MEDIQTQVAFLQSCIDVGQQPRGLFDVESTSCTGYERGTVAVTGWPFNDIGQESGDTRDAGDEANSSTLGE